MRIDEPIDIKTTYGRPVSFTGRRGCYRVRRVVGEWRTPGDSRLYRVQVDVPEGPAIAEVVGPADGGQRSWRLGRVWTSV